MRLRDAIDLLLLAALFGASFLFMRIAAPAFGAYALAALRVGIAALILLPIALVRQGARELRSNWKALTVMGLFTAALPFACFSYAALTLPAGVSALLNSTTPLWAAIIAWTWLGDRLTGWRLLGLAIGFAGALVLFGTPVPDSADGHFYLAYLAALAAPLFYGVAASYGQRYLGHTSALVNSTGSLAAAALMLLVPAWLTWPRHPIPWQAWLAVTLLAAVSTAFAYILFFRLLSRVGPVGTVSVTYLVPLFGIAWGALLLQEAITPTMIVAGCIILLGTTFATGIVPRHRVDAADAR
jgi:drug/metabolite transporter (DMT)-like permease